MNDQQAGPTIALTSVAASYPVCLCSSVRVTLHMSSIAVSMTPTGSSSNNVVESWDEAYGTN
jgi:hypothetical protein